MELKRIVRLYPAFDKRNPSPKKNYGIHGVDLLMMLKGEKGVVQFKVFTNWQLPHVTEEQLNKSVFDKMDIRCSFMPMPADVGYHSYTPMYEGQEPVTNSCEYLEGKPCYYDGSGLHAEEVFRAMLKEGDEGVWRELRDYYNMIFGVKEGLKL